MDETLDKILSAIKHIDKAELDDITKYEEKTAKANAIE